MFGLPLAAVSASETEEQAPQQDRLLSLLKYLEKVQKEDDRNLSFGLDANDKERALVASVILEVEQDTAQNLVATKNGKITFNDVCGDWKLLYTSSRTMIINKSLSGLGRSESELARAMSLVQKLGGNKFLGTVEFVEVFGSDSDKDNNSDSDEDEELMKLEVFITGEWFTKDERNAVTGTPTTSIVVEPSKVLYGPSTNNAQEWASLGPIKLLDLLYLSEDIMIARNNVNMDSLFVWQRVQSS